jgi:AraC-like DNA-binding protein
LSVSEQLFVFIANAGTAQGLFVVFLLNNRGVQRSRANVFLSILLLSLSFSIAHILYAPYIFGHMSLRIYSVGDPTFLLIAPLLWFYALELTGYLVIPSWKLVLHFLPFLFVIFFSLAAHWLRIDGTEDVLQRNHYLTNILFWFVVVLQFSCYQYFIHKRWKVFQSVIREEVSNTENVSISWLRFFLGVFLLVDVCFFLGLFGAIHLVNQEWLSQAVGIIFSMSVFALGYKGILQKEIFYTGLREPGVAKPPTSKHARVDEEWLRKLKTFMETRKPYLDPELTLSSLATELGISRSQLSQLINDGAGDNFYDFVNKYRVDEVKRLMLDPKFSNYNMLGLALEAGFKSKSTFNLIFKRFTGLTPTEFRKNISD